MRIQRDKELKFSLEQKYTSMLSRPEHVHSAKQTVFQKWKHFCIYPFLPYHHLSIRRPRSCAKKISKNCKPRTRATTCAGAEATKQTRHLTIRSAAIESAAPLVRILTKAEFYTFTKQTFALLNTQRLLAKAVSNHTSGD